VVLPTRVSNGGSPREDSTACRIARLCRFWCLRAATSRPTRAAAAGNRSRAAAAGNRSRAGAASAGRSGGPASGGFGGGGCPLGLGVGIGSPFGSGCVSAAAVARGGTAASAASDAQT
jgi:hypothetical protein